MWTFPVPSGRRLGNTLRTVAITLGGLCSCAEPATATPLTQKLSKGTSFIKFGVESPSPTLQMNGHVKDFAGEVTVTPSETSLSGLTLVVNLQSAQLPPDQLLQSVFLQSVIARLKQQVATFRSTTIDHVNDDDYLAVGTYSWHNKTRSATIPFQLVRVSPSRTELRIKMRGGLTAGTTPKELAAAAPGVNQSTGWATASLVFMPPEHS